MKKRVFLILICGILLFSFVACSNNKTEVTQSITHIEGIEFKIPKSWEKSDDETLVKQMKNSASRYGNLFTVNGVEFSLPNQGVGAVLYTQMPKELEESKKNEIMVTMRKNWMAAMSDTAEKTENLETQEIIIDGKKAERTFVNISKSGQEMYAEVITVVSGDKVYLMIFLVKNKNETSLKKSVSSIIENVDFN